MLVVGEGGQLKRLLHHKTVETEEVQQACDH